MTIQTTGKKEVDIGFDISTSVIGICVLDATTGNLEKLTYIDLTNSKFEDIYDKVIFARNEINDLINNNPWEIKNLIVEEFAKQFSAGFSSANTLFTLAMFNHAICQYLFDRINIKPNKVNVRTMRKLLQINIDYKDKSESTKQKIFKHVKNINPSFPWLTHVAKSGKYKDQVVYDKENEDMADSWVVAKGFWTLNSKSNNTITNTIIVPKKKTRRLKK